MRDELFALLQARRGHFRMESGYHSEHWFELDGLFADRRRVQPFVAPLARALGRHGATAICGPIAGGAILAEMIAGELGIQSFAAERIEPAKTTSGLFPVKYVLPAAMRAWARGVKVAIVDDAISAGSAVRGTHADLLACGAVPVALGALIVFGGKAAAFAAENGLPLEHVVAADFNCWSPAECPLCQRGAPLERVADA